MCSGLTSTLTPTGATARRLLAGRCLSTGEASSQTIEPSSERGNAPQHSQIDEPSSLVALTEDEFDPAGVMSRVRKASGWNQGRRDAENRNKFGGKWDHGFVRDAVDDYERHLKYVLKHVEASGSNTRKEGSERETLKEVLSGIHPDVHKCVSAQKLLSPKSLASVARALTRTRLDTPVLSQRIRDIERLIGMIGWTPITEELSYRLLEANCKSGNVRRALALLELRRARGYAPRESQDQLDRAQQTAKSLRQGEKEFIHVLTSIQSAQLPLRRSRNIFQHEADVSESLIDNPTRYLDAILINMNERGVPLTPELAAKMLNCYASTGRTGRATHFFYRVARGATLDDGDGDKDDDNARLKMRMLPLPPFRKIPSAAKGSSFAQDTEGARNEGLPNGAASGSGMTKYDQEIEREYSLSLTAAFAFADSLTHGACGHAPIELDIQGWNALIKACCNRGAFHRALKILNETLPQKGIEPDYYSYNAILAGLARVGDITSLKEYLMNMTNRRILINKFTVEAMADGFLNVGDISGASSMVQDIFNQHETLPPYTTHLKIIEFALSNGLIFEAKRHVYFVQQLWKWQPSQHHDARFIGMMETTRRNPKLSKQALQKMFQYFGEELVDDDFF